MEDAKGLWDSSSGNWHYRNMLKDRYYNKYSHHLKLRLKTEVCNLCLFCQLWLMSHMKVNPQGFKNLYCFISISVFTYSNKGIIFIENLKNSSFLSK